MTSKEALNEIRRDGVFAKESINGFVVDKKKTMDFDSYCQVILQALERLEVLELNLDSEKYQLSSENESLKNRVEDLEKCYKFLLKENSRLELKEEALTSANKELEKELDIFKLAFYSLWKCCNSDENLTDTQKESGTYLEFKCGFESMCIPASEQEIESIKKACEILDMEVKEVLGNE